MFDSVLGSRVQNKMKQKKVAVIGAGIIGMTNAICLLEKEFDVTIFTKDDPFKTNSDAAVATWYIPDDSKPTLQKLCIESLSIFETLNKIDESGVRKIPALYYFRNENEFNQSAWTKLILKPWVKIVDLSSKFARHDFQKVILVQVPLIDPNFYRPFLFNKFQQMGGRLERKKINHFSELINDYDVIINCAGWESKYLVNDDEIFPIRGQIEIAKNLNEDAYSFNISELDTYMIMRPQSNDFVLGTTFQMNDTDMNTREVDRTTIIRNAASFVSLSDSISTTSKVGIRCGRIDVRIANEYIRNKSGELTLIVHCYGHGGSGYSASWGSAAKVLENCFTHFHGL